jgi:hypothetical protein
MPLLPLTSMTSPPRTSASRCSAAGRVAKCQTRAAAGLQKVLVEDIGKRAHVRPDGDDQVDGLGCSEPGDFAVQALGLFAKLKHVAQHGDALALTGEAAQRPQGSAGAGGVCVVAESSSTPMPRELAVLKAAADGLAAQGELHVAHVHAADPAHGNRGQGVEDVVLAVQGRRNSWRPLSMKCVPYLLPGCLSARSSQRMSVPKLTTRQFARSLAFTQRGSSKLTMAMPSRERPRAGRLFRDHAVKVTRPDR